MIGESFMGRAGAVAPSKAQLNRRAGRQTVPRRRARTTLPTVSAATAQLIRRAVLAQAKRAKLGHIGSSLSIAELVAVLVDGALDLDRGDARRDRDRFVLA